MRRKTGTKLPAPYLKRVSLMADQLVDKTGYPYDLPWLQDREFELDFTTPVTIIVGENGTGKSTLIEAIAAHSGYDEAGGSKDHAAVDHRKAIDKSGALLKEVLRVSWLPKVTTGWFFKAETFFSVARYLDEVASPFADFLSASHGEGFIRLFEERMARQGIYFMDEPESALSPQRQLELLRILNNIQERANSQVIMATHSPILMALPNARLLEITQSGISETSYRNTQHFKLYQAFTSDPEDFIEDALRDDGLKEYLRLRRQE